MTEYYWLNGQLQAQKTGNEYIMYLYDETGSAVGFTYVSGTTQSNYYYVYNLQEDVIGIIDSNGTQVVEYTYDVWGAVLSTTGTHASTIGAINPLRYRGYYYDTETGFYYCTSRYYDPETYRWINADGYLSTGQDILGYNMFTYCLNNPTNYVDAYGYCPYNGTYADFIRLNQGLPSMDCVCDSVEEEQHYNIITREKPNMKPRKDERKGHDQRQPSGSRERNIAHPNGEEHSRVPKGNRGIKRTEATITLAVSLVVLTWLVVNDVSGAGALDDVAIVPTLKIIWDNVIILSY